MSRTGILTTGLVMCLWEAEQRTRSIESHKSDERYVVSLKQSIRYHQRCSTDQHRFTLTIGSGGRGCVDNHVEMTATGTLDSTCGVGSFTNAGDSEPNESGNVAFGLRRVHSFTRSSLTSPAFRLERFEPATVFKYVSKLFHMSTGDN